MAEIQITQQHIDNLAAKLQELSQHLAPEEKALLSAIVTMSGRVKAQVASPESSITDQFSGAFTPGQATFLVKAANIGK